MKTTLIALLISFVSNSQTCFESKTLSPEQIKKVLGKSFKKDKDVLFYEVKDDVSKDTNNIFIEKNIKTRQYRRPVQGGVCMESCAASAFTLIFNGLGQFERVEAITKTFPSFSTFTLQKYSEHSMDAHVDLTPAEMTKLTNFVKTHLKLKEKSAYFKIIKKFLETKGLENQNQVVKSAFLDPIEADSSFGGDAMSGATILIMKGVQNPPHIEKGFKTSLTVLAYAYVSEVILGNSCK